MDIKITRRELLKEVCNDMYHNYYWLIKGRIYNDNHSEYRKFHFVIWFDLFDVQEYFEAEDGVTKEEIMTYVDECAWCKLGMVDCYDDCNSFFEMCNETIDWYNNN